MEFFKGCRTNVVLVEDVHQVEWHHYQLQESDNILNSLTSVAKLRDLGILCEWVPDGVMIFVIPTPLDDEHEGIQPLYDSHARSLGLGKVDGNTLDHERSQNAVHDGMIKNLFRSAIRGAMGQKLGFELGFFRYNPETWLFQYDGDDTDETCESLLLSLQITYTASNALYITSAVKQVRLPSMRASKSIAETVYLAPFGHDRQARVICTLNGNKGGMDEEGLEFDTLKNMSIQLLAAEGISVQTDEEWCVVRPVDAESQAVLVWPNNLLSSQTSMKSSEPSGTDAWKAWFTSSVEPDGYKDPLNNAEAWCAGASERATAIKARKSQMAMIEEDIAVHTEGNPEVESLPVASPAFVHRTAEQHMAISGIYPTPPDGLAPVGQAPPLAMDSLMAGSGTDVTDHIGEYLPDAEAVREQSITSLDGAQGVASGDSDLFGENMAGMDFAAGEVGDADFSFFDEPDDLPATMENPEESDGMDVDVPDAELPQIQPRTQEVHETTKDDADEKPRPTGTDLSRHTSPKLSPEAVVKQHGTTANEDALRTQKSEAECLEKPLSPFGIRERLLPPPIPASAAQSHAGGGEHSTRRSSTFEPVMFRDGLQALKKYNTTLLLDTRGTTAPTSYDIGLPRKTKRTTANHEISSPKNPDSRRDEPDSESEESGSDDSFTSDIDVTSQLPWDSKKRKRTSQHDYIVSPIANATDASNGQEGRRVNVQDIMSCDTALTYLTKARDAQVVPDEKHAATSGKSRSPGYGPLDAYFTLNKVDMVYIAQIVTDQHVSCGLTLFQRWDDVRASPVFDAARCALTAQAVLERGLSKALHASNVCEIGDLAMAREAPGRSATATGPHRPGQPRPPQRTETVSLGPDIFSVPTPYICACRGQDMYEFLPPALSFWETLNLGPKSGAKDITAYCVYPFNEDLRNQVVGFLDSFGSIYEGCKLGTHFYLRTAVSTNKLDKYEDGLVPVELPHDKTLQTALAGYEKACTDFGAFLASIANQRSNRTTVIYMVNPFRDELSRHYLCAAFWLMYRAYRDKLPKGKKLQPWSDLVLQILPIELIAAQDSMVVWEPSNLATLAREVYDRCPPHPEKTAELSSPLPNFAAPFVELASTPPKRIGFQLTADPPNDLLHEGSTIHFAYDVSQDLDWMTVVWADNTGRYQNTVTMSMRGRALTDVASDVWRMTRDIIQAREVFWRIYILSNDSIDASVVSMWRTVIETPRKQPFSVTLLSARFDPVIKLRPPGPVSDDAFGQPTAPGAGFLTPATTPQASSSMTVSPDTGGQANAPSTPAPADAIANIVEQDPDAHLIDVTEETWAILLQPTIARIGRAQNPLVSGVLYKRGKDWIDGPAQSVSSLPSLGIDLMWTVQVRPNGNVDEGNIKQAEMTMREVLRLYRNLSVLSKAKRWTVSTNEDEIAPLHLVCAVKGAQGVDGLLR